MAGVTAFMKANLKYIVLFLRILALSFCLGFIIGNINTVSYGGVPRYFSLSAQDSSWLERFQAVLVYLFVVLQILSAIKPLRESRILNQVLNISIFVFSAGAVWTLFNYWGKSEAIVPLRIAMQFTLFPMTLILQQTLSEEKTATASKA
ncbi:hypothetical protein B9G69_005210 [Bdellovibrio sp. SKB1291214]|uniref:hypothetical protein n=1 Tax=Bdellovibrio sp. SKB1291214 TaxID=1732569 RepID=UPI000B5193C7|nr:hypothetical protein [Bdellovibrio sp. SKB1291214]UYL09973.1 hypothetical protein B9G69_005210 [Bdellovibrio sp. SKB1291214]